MIYLEICIGFIGEVVACRHGRVSYCPETSHWKNTVEFMLCVDFV